MTAALDFAMLPPEINSGRMYSGPGSSPMLAAASGWRALGAELRSTALPYRSVLSALTGEAWHGQAAASMAAAALPYVAWLSSTAAQAEQTAVQAQAAAAAYDAAFTATVPPPVIAANRAQLTALIATNVLGQNTPAIAATEAAYAGMWAQDAAAMYGYAASSAVATRLAPFVEPRQNTNSLAAATQSAAVSQAASTPAGTQQSTVAQLMSALPATLQNLASPGGWDPFAPGSAADTTGLDGVLNMLSGNNTAFGAMANSTLGNSIFSSGFYMPSNTIAPFMSLLGSGAANSAGDAAGAAGQATAGAVGEATAGPIGEIASIPGAVTGGLGEASLVGPLSVSPSWATPVSAGGTLGPMPDGTPMIAPPALAAGMPGVPIGGTGVQAYGRATPQYGFRPTFVARPPAAG